MAFASALAVRTVFLVIFHLYRLPGGHQHFYFGWEMGRIARSLVTGHGFSSPFDGMTGPSAWTEPLYPLIVAGVFRFFGIYTGASAIVLMLSNALLSSLIIFPLWEIGLRCFHSKVARTTIWLWALWPFTLQYVQRIWATNLATLLFILIVALALRMRGVGEAPQPLSTTATPQRWLQLGLLWGILAMSMASLLLFFPVLLLWLLLPAVYESGRPHLPRLFRRAISSFAITVICMMPWMVRNALVFHTFIPVRSNFGVELYLGNGPDSNGFVSELIAPADNHRQLVLYQRMGEIAYCQWRGNEAKAFMWAHPRHYAINTLKHVVYYWLGLPMPSPPYPLIRYLYGVQFAFFGTCGLLGLTLALRNNRQGAGLIALAFLFIPLVYYFVHVQNRFRYSLDPLLYCLTIYLWMSAEESNRVRWLTASWWRSRFSSH
jgi:hypothetical protein